MLQGILKNQRQKDKYEGPLYDGPPIYDEETNCDGDSLFEEKLQQFLLVESDVDAEVIGEDHVEEGVNKQDVIQRTSEIQGQRNECQD